MDFYKRLEIVCKSIPYGRVVTYGQLALLCQKPKNARQVGMALNHMLSGDIPAHRVVNHKGYLSGSAAFETNETQKKLLEKEGIIISDEQRADLKLYGWKNTLEEATALDEIFKKENI